MADVLLTVRDFEVSYLTADGPVRAVEGVSFDLRRGEVLGLVGESGSGKSTLVRGLLRVLEPPGAITGGDVHFDGVDLLAASEDALRALRWRRISIVPQAALNALNPVLTVGAQIVETLDAHGETSPTRARARAAEVLELVGIDPTHLRSYPHELSGGMRQRVALGLALACGADLVVMDEPTTALDVVVEHELLQRVAALQAQRGFAVLFITHDLLLLDALADRVGVLYSGRLVELGPTDVLARGGRHPYTRGLRGAIPPALGEDRVPVALDGSSPNLRSPPSGCRFHPRCAAAVAACRVAEPTRREVGPGHLVACHVEAP